MLERSSSADAEEGNDQVAQTEVWWHKCTSPRFFWCFILLHSYRFRKILEQCFVLQSEVVALINVTLHIFIGLF